VDALSLIPNQETFRAMDLLFPAGVSLRKPCYYIATQLGGP